VEAQSCRCGEAAKYDLAMQIEQKIDALSAQLGRAQSDIDRASKKTDGIVEAFRASAGQADAQDPDERGKQLDRIAELINAGAAQADVAQADARSEFRQRAEQLDGIAKQVQALAAKAGAQMDQLMDQSNAVVAKLADVHAVVAKTKRGTSGQVGKTRKLDEELIMASRDEEVVIGKCGFPKDRLESLEYFLRGAMRSPSDIRESIAAELKRVAGGSYWNVLLSDGGYLLNYAISAEHACIMDFGRLNIVMWRA